MGTGTQELGPSSDAFPEHNHGAELEVEQMGFEPVPIWNVGDAGSVFIRYATVPALWDSILISPLVLFFLNKYS